MSWAALILPAAVALVAVIGLPVATRCVVPSPEAVLAQYGTLGRADSSATREHVAFAVGANACLDLIVPAKEVLQRLQAKLPSDSDYAVLSTMDEFLAVLGTYARRGSAAERFVRNDTVFRQLVDAAAAVASARYSVGGNAALMAAGAVSRGLKRVLLGGIVGSKQKSLLPDSLDVAGPTGIDDQVHLILEYAKDEELVPGLIPPRANRFIVSADYPNAKQAASPFFFERLQRFNPDVVVFSGLHLLDGISDRAERIKHLEDVRSHIAQYRQRSPHVPMHFEFASIGDKTIVKHILELVIDQFDSVGCNEEELWSLYTALNGTLPQSVFSHAPAVADIERALATVMAGLPAHLTRIHFHTLGLHVIVTRAGSERLWRPADEYEAVLTGALATSLRVCEANVSELNLERFEFKSSLSFRAANGVNFNFSPGAQWVAEGLTYSVCPVPVCRKRQQKRGPTQK